MLLASPHECMTFAARKSSFQFWQNLFVNETTDWEKLIVKSIEAINKMNHEVEGSSESIVTIVGKRFNVDL